MAPALKEKTPQYQWLFLFSSLADCVFLAPAHMENINQLLEACLLAVAQAMRLKLLSMLDSEDLCMLTFLVNDGWSLEVQLVGTRLQTWGLPGCLCMFFGFLCEVKQCMCQKHACDLHLTCICLHPRLFSLRSTSLTLGSRYISDRWKPEGQKRDWWKGNSIHLLPVWIQPVHTWPARERKVWRGEFAGVSVQNEEGCWMARSKASFKRVFCRQSFPPLRTKACLIPFF